jgi:phosphate transport system ATP-binding protein
MDPKPLEEKAPPLVEKINVSALNAWYGDQQVLFDLNLGIRACTVTAIIGPSGCGKTTLLRLINRLNDRVLGAKMTGIIRMDGRDIYAPEVQVSDLRKRVGMVFQKPNPFPGSVFENVSFGLKIRGMGLRSFLQERVERSLRQVHLWDEVKDKLHASAYNLSGGQQQRLCLARALAVEPSVLLMDEPASSLDPINTARIEELIVQLKTQHTVVIVTHNMQQAGRTSDTTAFLHKGRLIELADTATFFTNPKNPSTQDYITGRFRL